MQRLHSEPENGSQAASGNSLLFGYFVFPDGWETLSIEELKEKLGDGKNMKITTAPQVAADAYFNRPEELTNANYCRFLKSIKNQIEGIGTVEWIFLIDPSTYEVHGLITESLFHVSMIRLKDAAEDKRHDFWRLPEFILKTVFKLDK